MRGALLVEWWKVRRSSVTVTASGLLVLMLPAMGLAFYEVAVNGGNGALAGKAGALLSEAGWKGYLGLVDQIVAVALFLGVGVVVAWMFGREHVDRTFPSLFSRPVSTFMIAGAKYLVMALWLLGVAISICLVTVGLGLGVSVGEWADSTWGEIMRLLAVSIAAGLLGLSMGYIASVGRGYLPAIGALIVLIAASQVAVLLGTGGWFPFAVPGLLAVSGTDDALALSAAQVALVPATAAIAVTLTLKWWRDAEVV